MPDSEDRDVLEFIGAEGKTFEELEERFPTFDLLRVIRPGLVEMSRTQSGNGAMNRFEDRYVLTELGASAVGVTLSGSLTESDGEFIELSQR